MAITPSPVDILSSEDLAEFKQRLHETQMWCQMRAGKANAQQVFRTQELKPEKLDALEKEYETMAFGDMCDAVTQLSKRRRELLKFVPEIAQSSLNKEGKLLA